MLNNPTWIEGSDQLEPRVRRNESRRLSHATAGPGKGKQTACIVHGSTLNTVPVVHRMDLVICGSFV